MKITKTFEGIVLTAMLCGATLAWANPFHEPIPVSETPVQSEKKPKTLKVTDFSADPEKPGSCLFIVEENYYIADSFDSFIQRKGIDPKKDIKVVHVAHPSTLEPVRKMLPEKYRKNFKNQLTIELKK